MTFRNKTSTIFQVILKYTHLIFMALQKWFKICNYFFQESIVMILLVWGSNCRNGEQKRNEMARIRERAAVYHVAQVNKFKGNRNWGLKPQNRLTNLQPASNENHVSDWEKPFVIFKIGISSSFSKVQIDNLKSQEKTKQTKKSIVNLFLSFGLCLFVRKFYSMREWHPAQKNQQQHQNCQIHHKKWLRITFEKTNSYKINIILIFYFFHRL